MEADGGQHAEHWQYDRVRTEYFERRGYRVLRFWNDEILLQTDAVLEVILKAVVTTQQ